MNIVISNASQEPIYQQIITQLKNLIIQGGIAQGEALPSIRTLAKNLQISVITTKRAYEELERDGYIHTVPGKGSFVAAQNQELLKETRLRIVEEKLTEAVTSARTIGVSRTELRKMLDLMYED